MGAEDVTISRTPEQIEQYVIDRIRMLDAYGQSGTSKTHAKARSTSAELGHLLGWMRGGPRMAPTK